MSRPGRWYRRLEKSPLNPPPAVFGPVWTVLYGLIATSGWRVWRAGSRKALGWWAAQLALNAAWSPIFFGLKRPRAALADLALLLPAIAIYARHARQVDRPAAWMVAPYLGWVGFASVLNAEIVRRNRSRRVENGRVVHSCQPHLGR